MVIFATTMVTFKHHKYTMGTPWKSLQPPWGQLVYNGALRYITAPPWESHGEFWDCCNFNTVALCFKIHAHYRNTMEASMLIMRNVDAKPSTVYC